MRPELRQIVLDTTDARTLANFYRDLLGWDYRPGDEPPATGEPDPRGEDWLVLVNPDGRIGMAFQAVDDLPPTTWPDAGVPQQAHLDLSVPDVDALLAVRSRAVGMGATLRFDRLDDPDEPLFVFADPSGHLFCVFVE